MIDRSSTTHQTSHAAAPGGHLPRGREAGLAPAPPTTLIGVAALDVPDHLVEIEATAILD